MYSPFFLRDNIETCHFFVKILNIFLSFIPEIFFSMMIFFWYVYVHYFLYIRWLFSFNTFPSVCKSSRSYFINTHRKKASTSKNNHFCKLNAYLFDLVEFWFWEKDSFFFSTYKWTFSYDYFIFHMHVYLWKFRKFQTSDAVFEWYVCSCFIFLAVYFPILWQSFRFLATTQCQCFRFIYSPTHTRTFNNFNTTNR